MEIFKFLTVFILLNIFGDVYSIQTYYMDNRCNSTISVTYMEQIRIKSSRGHSLTDTVCHLTISAEVTDRMMILFKGLNMEESDECENEYLTIYDGQLLEYSPKPSIIGKPKFCGSTLPSTVYESSDDYITLLFHSDRHIQAADFDMIVTQFHTGYCYTWETKCSNKKCIDDSLACNGYNPCGDGSDCKGRTLGIIIGCTVGGAALLAIIFAIAVCVYCARRRNTGRAGYLTREAPTLGTTNPSSFGTAYSYPPAYNQTAYGIGTGGQQQQQLTYPTV